MFGRYEKHDNSINKHAYYELTSLADGRVQINWGRIGTKGQMQIVSDSEADTRIRKKRVEGYLFKSSVTENAGVASVKEKTPAQPEHKEDGFSFSSWLGD